MKDNALSIPAPLLELVYQCQPNPNTIAIGLPLRCHLKLAKNKLRPITMKVVLDFSQMFSTFDTWILSFNWIFTRLINAPYECRIIRVNPQNPLNPFNY